MKKIYISGRITGLDNAKVFKLFYDASLTLFNANWCVVNPMTLNHDHDKSWLNYMRVDLKALIDCDTIYMLSNWEDSRGAKIEHDLAQSLGLEIIYEK